MAKSVRDRIRFNRRRLDFRKYINIRNITILSFSVAAVIITSTIIGANMLKNKVNSSTVVYKPEEEVAEVNLNKDDIVDPQDSLNIPVEEIVDENKDDVKTIQNDETITMSLLGEMMFGGEVTTNLNYSYLKAIKDVYSITRDADFTYGNFSTNITNLEKIENPKSKYIVTKEIKNALTTLGVDSLSIASDHIVDFPEDIIKNTVNSLEENDIFVAGRENTPVYFQKKDKKIAIVSTNAVIIGTSKNYTKYGISTYSSDNLKKNIKEAKETADIVIADIHWGREHTYGITDQMRNIAKVAIDAGADMVMGSHALGVYPVVTYNEKPIIYSTGHFISDSDYNVAKEGYIFKVHISKEARIDSLEMIPIYIEDKKDVRLYNEYDKDKCDSLLNQFNKWHIENSLNSNIENGHIVIKL